MKVVRFFYVSNNNPQGKTRIVSVGFEDSEYLEGLELSTNKWKKFIKQRISKIEDVSDEYAEKTKDELVDAIANGIESRATNQQLLDLLEEFTDLSAFEMTDTNKFLIRNPEIKPCVYTEHGPNGMKGTVYRNKAGEYLKHIEGQNESLLIRFDRDHKNEIGTRHINPTPDAFGKILVGFLNGTN